MASQCTLNGLPVWEGSITFPRIGVWHADLSISSSVAPSGKAALVLGSQTWRGFYSLQSGLDLIGRQRVRVVGGNGTLGSVVPARGYNACLARLPIQDAIQDAKEVMSQASDPGVLNASLLGWVRFQIPGNQALVAILKAITSNPSWRVLPDGTIWVGFETWPGVILSKASYVKLDPANTSLLIGAFDPNVQPGELLTYTLANQPPKSVKVSTVTHTVTGGMIRSLVRYENY